MYPEIYRAIAKARTDDLLREAAQQRRVTQMRTVQGGRWRDRFSRVLQRPQPMRDDRRPWAGSKSVISTESVTKEERARTGYRRLIDGQSNAGRLGAALSICHHGAPIQERDRAIEADLETRKLADLRARSTRPRLP